METAAVALQHPLAPEDQARADFYALLARLFADAAGCRAARGDRARGAARRRRGAETADDAAAGLPAAWNALRAASAAMDPDAAAEEYKDLFVGVGKSEVNLHASHWLDRLHDGEAAGRAARDARRLGLAPPRRRRRCSRTTSRALCETMRILVAGTATAPPAPIAEQRAFFERHIAPWVLRLLHCNTRLSCCQLLPCG